MIKKSSPSALSVVIKQLDLLICPNFHFWLAPSNEISGAERTVIFPVFGKSYFLNSSDSADCLEFNDSTWIYWLILELFLSEIIRNFLTAFRPNGYTNVPTICQKPTLLKYSHGSHVFDCCTTVASNRRRDVSIFHIRYPSKAHAKIASNHSEHKKSNWYKSTLLLTIAQKFRRRGWISEQFRIDCFKIFVVSKIVQEMSI